MKTYAVTGAGARLVLGTLRLTKEQAASRKHALLPLGEDTYTLTGPVEFKHGEIFGYDQPIPKTLAEEIGEVEESILLDLDAMEQSELLQVARQLDLSPHPNTGKAKLLDMIHAREDELLQAQQARIAELEAKVGELTDEEAAELARLKG